jgi:hypothetical protein
MAGPFDHRIPSGPLERDPTSRHLTTDEQRELLLGALDGIELGVWDRSIVEWLSAYDAATVLTVCSLIRRVRLHVRPKRLMGPNLDDFLVLLGVVRDALEAGLVEPAALELRILLEHKGQLGLRTRRSTTYLRHELEKRRPPEPRPPQT